MNQLSINQLKNELYKNFYSHGDAETIFPIGFINSEDWKNFSYSWENLEEDQYMGDGGKYRYRRYSEFSIFLIQKQFNPYLM